MSRPRWRSTPSDVRRALPILLVAAAAQAELTRQCLDEADSGNGLSVAVDSTNVLHLGRVRRVLGDVVHTTIAADGAVTNEVVVRAASRLGVDEIVDTDLLLVDDVPWLCFYNAAAQRLEVARRGEDEWVRETVAMGVGAGRSCALGRAAAGIVMAYGHDGALWFARRGEDGSWATEPIDDGGPDNDAGSEVDLSIGPGDTPVVVHGDTTLHKLHVTWFSGSWRTVEVSDAEVGYGARPAVVHRADGGIWVAHGLIGGGRRDLDSDVGLLLTGGRLPGPFETDSIEPARALGGSNAVAMQGDRLLVFTRQYLRSALFPDDFDIRLYSELPDALDNLLVERASVDDGTRLFNFLGLALDPFELASLAYTDDEETCVQRPLDSDEDGLPDEVEADYGTEVDNPDTDDDGVSDGMEVLRDRTNPLGDGPLEPDAAAPDMAVDAAAPDASGDAALDAAVPDMDLDAAEADAAQVDAAQVDAARVDAVEADAVEADAVEADAAEADAAQADAAQADAAQVDAAAADAAQVDIAQGDATPADATAADDAGADAAPGDGAPGDAAGDRGAEADGGADGPGSDATEPDAAIPDVGEEDARPPLDGGRLLASDVRVDGELPALTSYQPSDRGSACACRAGERADGSGWWLLSLVALRRRRLRR